MAVDCPAHGHQTELDDNGADAPHCCVTVGHRCGFTGMEPDDDGCHRILVPDAATMAPSLTRSTTTPQPVRVEGKNGDALVFAPGETVATRVERSPDRLRELGVAIDAALEHLALPPDLTHGGPCDGPPCPVDELAGLLTWSREQGIIPGGHEPVLLAVLGAGQAKEHLIEVFHREFPKCVTRQDDDGRVEVWSDWPKGSVGAILQRARER